MSSAAHTASFLPYREKITSPASPWSHQHFQQRGRRPYGMPKLSISRRNRPYGRLAVLMVALFVLFAGVNQWFCDGPRGCLANAAWLDARKGSEFIGGGSVLGPFRGLITDEEVGEVGREMTEQEKEDFGKVVFLQEDTEEERGRKWGAGQDEFISSRVGGDGEGMLIDPEVQSEHEETPAEVQDDGQEDVKPEPVPVSEPVAVPEPEQEPEHTHVDMPSEGMQQDPHAEEVVHEEEGAASPENINLPSSTKDKEEQVLGIMQMWKKAGAPRLSMITE